MRQLPAAFHMSDGSLTSCTAGCLASPELEQNGSSAFSVSTDRPKYLALFLVDRQLWPPLLLCCCCRSCCVASAPG
jgi:hypothetical protein